MILFPKSGARLKHHSHARVVGHLANHKRLGIGPCGRQVIGAKDRAKFLAANPKTAPEKRAQKEEMAQWMLVWLENPEVFPAWVEVRKRAL